MRLLVHHHRLFAYSNDLATGSFYSYNGRLIDYYRIIVNDQCIGSSKVYCNLLS